MLSNIVLNELGPRAGEKKPLPMDGRLSCFTEIGKGRKAGDGWHSEVPVRGITPSCQQREIGGANIKDAPFLGFQILRGKIRVSNKALITFKRRGRELTQRNGPHSMHQNIQEINKYL